MTVLPILARAHVASTRNHLTAQLGGVVQRNVVLAAGAILLLAYNSGVYVWSSSLLGGLIDDPAAAATIVPVLPIILTLPAYGIALILTMLLPVESPLALQARLLGASRWYCAVSEFLPIAGAVAVAAALGLSGSFVFLAGISAVPVATFLSLMLLAVAFGFLCQVVTLAVERVLGLLRVPPRERRLWGVIVAALGMSFVAVDLVRWAADGGRPRGFSLVASITGWWGEMLPQSWLAVLALAGLSTLLLVLGAALSSSDPAGGYLRAGTVAVRVPALRSFGGQLVATELATWMRDSTSRVSFGAMIAIDAGLVVAARSHMLDPGIVLLFLVLVSATGGELIIGRSRDINWTLRAIGMRDASVLWLRVGVVGVALTAVFTAAMFATGLIDNDPMRIAEAYSLFFAIFAIATLAGAVIPFDERAALGMFATSALSIVLEIVVIVMVTTILQLTGFPLVAADLTVAAVCGALTWAAFARSRSAGP